MNNLVKKLRVNSRVCDFVRKILPSAINITAYHSICMGCVWFWCDTIVSFFSWSWKNGDFICLSSQPEFLLSWFHILSLLCSIYQLFNGVLGFNFYINFCKCILQIKISNFIHVNMLIKIFLFKIHSFTASLPGTTTAHQLVQAIRQKCTADEVLNILNDLPNPENDNEMVEMTYNPLKIDVFVQTLLNLGSKSFSHSFAAIAKFHQVFKVSFPSRHF